MKAHWGRWGRLTDLRSGAQQPNAPMLSMGTCRGHQQARQTHQDHEATWGGRQQAAACVQEAERLAAAAAAAAAERRRRASVTAGTITQAPPDPHAPVGDSHPHPQRPLAPRREARHACQASTGRAQTPGITRSASSVPLRAHLRPVAAPLPPLCCSSRCWVDLTDPQSLHYRTLVDGQRSPASVLPALGVSLLVQHSRRWRAMHRAVSASTCRQPRTLACPWRLSVLTSGSECSSVSQHSHGGRPASARPLICQRPAAGAPAAPPPARRPAPPAGFAPRAARPEPPAPLQRVGRRGSSRRWMSTDRLRRRLHACAQRTERQDRNACSSACPTPHCRAPSIRPLYVDSTICRPLTTSATWPGVNERSRNSSMERRCSFSLINSSASSAR